MKVWIDLDNSPHVLFFAPIIRQLERDGAEVIVTIRSFSQTEELASAHGLKFKTIGDHKTPRLFVSRAAATFRRAGQLARYMHRLKPDVAVSHGSRALVLTARMLGIPSMTMYDYEFVSSRLFNKMSTRILAPSVVSPETLYARGLHPRNFTPYPGLKEEVYVYDFQPDASILSDLDLDPEKVIVTLRPAGEWAHYHNQRSELLFRALVARLRASADIQVVVLARTAGQREKLRSTMGGAPFQFVEHAIDGLSLIWFSDAVFSGGGTMVREAALLGSNVYSIFGGELGSADRFLASTGRLKLIRDPNEIQNLSFRKNPRLPLPQNANRQTRDFIYHEIFEFARIRCGESTTAQNTLEETRV